VHAQLINFVLAASSSGGSSKGSSSGAYSILFLVAIFGLAYLVFIRPARRRQMAAQQARRVAEVGDEIITTSGLIATVTEVTDDYLTLEIAPGVHARYVPAAILRVNVDEPEPDPAVEASNPDMDASNHEVIDDTPEQPSQDT
jgi:preprotein translocase subunit YajC